MARQYAIQERHQQGLSLTSLFYAVHRYFGDWDDALAAAGVVRSEGRP